ncbi:DUF1705 domain-containing protein [Kalamiella piersonii]|nr:DUF1705 domain-containing protein [Pantoea piersonii]NYB09234.1 DUF1705 domain-containing protein [Pantoea piersonii]NYB36648.1 DUF1705 domain-containing protein [Pantoea piersonii]RKJ83250.1 DUF1705 domain-containing protein [Pantoea piersonii]
MSAFHFRKPVMHRITFIVLFSLYITVFLNIAYYRQALTLIPLTGLHNILFFLSMPVVVFSVINIVITLASFVWLDRVTVALFILVAAPAQFFIQQYGIAPDRSMITHILNTTPAEIRAILTTRMVLVLFFSGGAMAALAFWPCFKKFIPLWKGPVYRVVNIDASVTLVALVMILFYKDYASLFRNNPELVSTLSPSNFIVASLSYYYHR